MFVHQMLVGTLNSWSTDIVTSNTICMQYVQQYYSRNFISFVQSWVVLDSEDRAIGAAVLCML